MIVADAQKPPAAEPKFDAVAEAKQLLRTARWAALATLVPDSGYPFATLANSASAPDGSPILLLSQLSAHRRHIAADPRVSLLFYLPGRGDPLALPRLTVLGRAQQADDPEHRAALRARFLARHPKSALYADFPDFAFFRVAMEAVHLNGGFGRAAPLTPAEALTELVGAQSLIEQEAALIAAVNARGPAFLARLAGAAGTKRSVWRAIGLDPEGLDLAAGASVARLDFASPAKTPAEWLAAVEAAAE